MATPTYEDAAGPARRPLARHSASELIVNELREEILEGSLRPGQSLREVDLCERYGVARNTVREALRLLTRDGLGTHEVHHGVTVRTFTPEEVRTIFELREVLEETAARRAGTLVTAEVAHLERILSDSEDAFRRGEHKVGTNANLAFHRELVKLVGNRRLDEMFAQLLTEVRLILASMEERSGGDWIPRNRSLLQALLDGDARRYKRELAEYIDLALQEATRSLPSL